MLNKDSRSLFSFCTRWNFPLARIAVGRKNCMARLCYVTTQQYRMYLQLSASGLSYIPCIKEEHQWITDDLLPRVPQPEFKILFHDVVTLQRVMTEHFFLQYPKAEECFFESLPTTEEVMMALSSNPKGEELSARFYLFHTEEDKDVDDGDGVVVILVEEGRLMLPYSYLEGRSKDYTLQLYRAKLHPDSLTIYYGNKFWKLVDKAVDTLRGVSWGNFRRKIDAVVR